MFEQVGLKTSVFVSPKWKLSSDSIEVLEKLGFSLAEMQEEYFLLSHKPFKKIKVPKVLSWPSGPEYCKNQHRGKTFRTVRRFK
jgi:predicted deacetylase